MNKIVSNLQ